jgi:hypothetical protein
MSGIVAGGTSLHGKAVNVPNPLHSSMSCAV